MLTDTGSTEEGEVHQNHLWNREKKWWWLYVAVWLQACMTAGEHHLSSAITVWIKKRKEKKRPAGQDWLPAVMRTLAPLQLVKPSLEEWPREPCFIVTLRLCSTTQLGPTSRSVFLLNEAGLTASVSSVGSRPLVPFIGPSESVWGERSLHSREQHWRQWLCHCCQVKGLRRAAFTLLHLLVCLLHGDPCSLCNTASSAGPWNPEPPHTQSTLNKRWPVTPLAHQGFKLNFIFSGSTVTLKASNSI